MDQGSPELQYPSEDTGNPAPKVPTERNPACTNQVPHYLHSDSARPETIGFTPLTFAGQGSSVAIPSDVVINKTAAEVRYVDR